MPKKTPLSRWIGNSGVQEAHRGERDGCYPVRAATVNCPKFPSMNLTRWVCLSNAKMLLHVPSILKAINI